MCFKISMEVSVDEETFTLNSVVRGHHIYKLTWTPIVGQELQAAPEPSNIKDGKAVATFLEGDVGHLPIEFSKIAWHFILFSMEAEFPA